MTTPKEDYDARKAVRDAAKANMSVSDQQSMEALDTLDRVATAFERMANAVEILASSPK